MVGRKNTDGGNVSDSWNPKNRWRERIPNRKTWVQNWREHILRSENKILMKILKFKWSRIGLIVEFHGIPNGFPNLATRQRTIAKNNGHLKEIKACRCQPNLPSAAPHGVGSATRGGQDQSGQIHQQHAQEVDSWHIVFSNAPPPFIFVIVEQQPPHSALPIVASRTSS